MCIGIYFFVATVLLWNQDVQSAICQESPGPEKLVVATKVSPPFSFRQSDGKWTGISIDLWRAITDELGVESEFRELELNQFYPQVGESVPVKICVKR